MIPRIRVHEQLGVLLRWPDEDRWLWVCRGRELSQRMTDRWAHGPGWVELDPAANAELRAELGQVRADLDREVSLRTLGGTPPPVDENWANITTVPPSASDDRMPAHRRAGLASSSPGTTNGAPRPTRAP